MSGEGDALAGKAPASAEASARRPAPAGLRVLMIAYHFPPLQGSSGILRTLKFVKHLRSYGVEPTVLTVSPRAYERTDPGLLAQIPEGVEVARAFALDTRKHLSLKGRYPSVLSVPDRYVTWIPGGVLAGLGIVRRKGIDAIFSTYPVATAHVIGMSLARLTGLPWVADFRDPMWDAYSQAPSDLVMAARKRIEALTIRRCSAAVMNTPAMHAEFLSKYPEADPSRFSMIPNGFDEADFAGVEPAMRRPGQPVRLIHAGLLERADRDPGPFFRALAKLASDGRVSPGTLQVDLVATGNDADYLEEVGRLGLSGIVRFHPPVPYAQALKRMADSDVLLLFQGPSCDAQIPAKLYEYMRIGKPIFAVATARGETGRMVAGCRAGAVVPHDDADAIAGTLSEWLKRMESGDAPAGAARETAENFSRQNQARALAGIFDAVCRRN